MNRSKIEWCDYTINPVKGLCPVGCSYCYARRLYKRFKWNPNIRADWQETGKLPTKPSRIFVGSTIELFGDWVKPEWMKEIFSMVNRYPQHTFIFLTKRPENLIKWSPFPPNAWVGLSVDGTENAPLRRIYNGLADTKATVKFISFEPLLASTNLDYRDLEWAGINWLIIGQQTPEKITTMPEIEWITDIVKAADKFKIPVFLKNNLESLIHHEWQDNVYAKLLRTPTGKLRQEFPK